MKSIVGFYRRLQLLQSRLWMRIVLSVLALAACAGYFIPILTFSYEADRERSVIFEALMGPEAEENQRVLRETGTIVTTGRVYEIDERFMPDLFDEEGQLINPQFTVFLALQEDFQAMLEWAPRWLVTQPDTTWVVGGLTLAWLWMITWIGLIVPFLITVGATLGLYLLTGWLGLSDLQLGIAGIGLLTFTFLLLVRLLLVILSWPNQVMSVAHTVIKEASRTRLTVLFIIVILILLPLLPLTLDADSALRYQVQNFMSRSLEYTFALAACMTLLLACGTVAFEIRDRHIWHVMSKPVGQFQYLVGKWLGIVLLNGCVLAVAGVSVFLYIQYLRTTNVSTGMAADEDRFVVAEEILAAREYTQPVMATPDEVEIDAEIDRIIANDSAYSTYGEEGILPQVRWRLRKDLLENLERQQRTIPPGRNGQPGGRTFRFEGLQEARTGLSPLTLSYQFIIRQADEHERYVAGFLFNDDRENVLLREYIPTVPQVIRIPPGLVRPDGTLDITILNYFEPPPGRYFGQIFFEQGRFEILYRVGGFETNFLRAMLVLLIKLGVLAGLGVFFATFLNFPVACLSAFTVFVGGQMAPYLADSLTLYFPEKVDDVDWDNMGQVMKWGFESTIRGLAQGMVFMLGAFGEYHPVGDLVEGRNVGWRVVLSSFWRLEVIWGGITLVLGWLVLRSRQLAIYSGGQS
ncbi:MAG: hypothetical protein MK116_11420 [Phycisphaerales bacterium]|nr:hypothetical protein [Phycisphaerales bacterium]